MAHYLTKTNSLSELLHEDFKIKQILENEGHKETEDDKFNRVDILVKNKKGELVIVEIQNLVWINKNHPPMRGSKLLPPISRFQPDATRT